MTADAPGMSGVVSTLLTRRRGAATVDGVPPPRNRVRFADAAKALLRDTLFDAASELIERQTWAQTRMADIAKVAGVSRQTLYKEFGSRHGFAQAYVIREAERFLAGVEDAIAANADSPRRALAAAVEVFLEQAAAEPMILGIVRGDADDGLLSLVTNQAGPVLGFATDRLAAFLTQTWPDVDDAAVRLVAESTVRLGISHAASATGTPQQTAVGLAELLGPYLDATVDAAATGRQEAEPS